MVSPLGLTTDSTWEGLLAGKSGIGSITRFDTSEFTSKIAGEVKDFDPLDYVDRKNARKMDRFIMYAIAAGDAAFASAGLEKNRDPSPRVGVFIGSGIGGFETIEKEHEKFMNAGPRRISPFFIPASIINEAAGQVSIRLGAGGPNSATCTACTAGCHAIGDSFKIIQRGDADVMVAGGSEAAITPMGVGGFSSLKALSTRNEDPQKASRPFDIDRDGFVVGEGAGLVVLEELGHAKKRGATILAELVGYGMSGDAFHITLPPEDGSGAVRAMDQAVRDAGVDIDLIDYINAHGTSTPPNDRIETLSIKNLFGAQARRLAISSTKSMTGHLLGAAGGLEAGISVLSVYHQVVPPTINLDNADPACDLDYVPHDAREMKIRYALSNSFGFGGTNGALIFKRFSE